MDRTAPHSPAESLPRQELEQLQLERLQSALNRVYRNVTFYRQAFDAHRVNLETIRDVRALAGLPFTTGEDLCRAYPYDMFALPLRDIVRIHSSSSRTDRPIVVGHTRNDLRHWTECTARLLSSAGVDEHDVVQIALDYSLSAGGFGFHQGAEQLGASVIPAGQPAGVDKQIVIMRDFKTTCLVTSPSHAANLAEGLAEARVHVEQLHLRLGIFGAERWGEPARRRLEEQLHMTALDTYGQGDVLGPGVAGECPRRRGLHVNEDHFIVEVIDPQTLEPVANGAEGELVFTTITREGFPLVRYRTGDIASVDRSPCACGRSTARMSRVRRRIDDLIQFHGVSFLPAQIEEILANCGQESVHYQIVLDRAGGTDTLEIRLEVSDRTSALDEPRALGTLRARISRRIKSALDIEAKVAFVEPRSLRHLADGAGRVLDKRTG